MKKLKYILHSLPAVAIISMLGACQDNLAEEELQPGNGGVTFLISAPLTEETWQTRGEDGDVLNEKLLSLRYMLADGEGNVLNHHYGKLSPDLDRLNLDGLRPGNYSVVFLGTSEESPLASISEPSRLDDSWLSNTVANLPLEGSFFFKKVDFTVDLEPKAMTRTVVLDRPLAKIKVTMPELPTIIEENISSVVISVDGSDFYSDLKADGSYGGSAEVKDYEVHDKAFNLELSTLPSAAPISGTVKVRAATMDGDSIFTSYRFENLKVEPGKVTTVSVKLNHPDMRTGFTLIRPQDYYDYDADLMLMEDEPLSVLHDSNHRFYPVLHPLVVSTWESNMRVRLFAPAAVEDVDIYADFPSLGLDSVKVARIERVEAYVDMLVPMPFLERDCEFYDSHGKRVNVPRMNTIPNDVKWYISTPDEWLAQLDALKFKNWNCWCPAHEKTIPDLAVPPTCQAMRHAMVIPQFLAVMYDSEEFYAILAAHEGEYIDRGVYLSNELILSRINGLNFAVGSAGAGAAGVGGGSYFLLKDFYWCSGAYPGSDPNVVVSDYRSTVFHEIGHCCGWSHDGNMTYGDRWITDCSTAYVQCYRNGKMKYGVPKYIDAIPYARADAPKWCRPRFAEKPQAQSY